MKLLNTLKAAPGQHNRALVTHFLLAKKWIKAEQSPDDWPVSHLPVTSNNLAVLIDEMFKFERELRETAHDAEVENLTK